MKTYRFATWNAHEGIPSDRSTSEHENDTVEATMKAMSELDIDVLALQEVDFSESGQSTLIDELVRRTPMRYSYGQILSPSAFVPGRHSGVALLSSRPLTDAGSELLRNPELVARRDGEKVTTFSKGMVHAMVDLEGVRVAVGSIHAYPFHFFGRDAKDPAFANIWDELARSLDGLAADALVVAGDFNTHDRSLLLDRLQRNLRRTVRVSGGARRRQVDDILHSDQLSSNQAASAVRTLSDHDLFYVDLDLAEDRVGDQR